MLNRLALGIKPELGHPPNKLLKEHLNFGPCERGANAFVGAIAKGVVVKRAGATVKIDFHGVFVESVVNT